MTKMYQNCKIFFKTLSKSLQIHTPPKNTERDRERKEKEKQTSKKEFITPKIKSITELYGVLRDNTCFLLYRMKLVNKFSMPAGTQGDPVNSLQLQINSGEGVIAHDQMYFIIINTKEKTHRKKGEPTFSLWHGRFLFVLL